MKLSRRGQLREAQLDWFRILRFAAPVLYAAGCSKEEEVCMMLDRAIYLVGGERVKQLAAEVAGHDTVAGEMDTHA